MSLSESAPTNGSRRLQFGLGDLLLAVAVVAVYLAAYVSIFRGISTQEAVRLAAFTVMVVVGTILGVMLPHPWVKRRAGRVVVRLRGRRPNGSWFVWTCLVPVIAILVVQLPDLWPDSSPLIRILLTLFITQSACFTVWTVGRRSVTICDRGIVTNVAAFSPWYRIRSSRLQSRRRWQSCRRPGLVARGGGRAAGGA